MQTLFLLLGTPFIAYLTFIRPFQTEKLSRGTVKHPNPKFRLQFYQRSINFKIIASLYVVVIMAVTGQPLAKLVAPVNGTPLLPSGLWLTLLVVAVELFILTELLNHFAKIRHVFLVGDINVIVPRNTRERLWWIPTAIAAGVGEELVYRSFMIYFFTQLPVHISLTSSLIITSVLFGFAHLYQGTFGVVGTGIAGYVLGSLFIDYGLISVILIHSLIDLRVALLKPERAKRTPVKGQLKAT